MRRGYKRRSMNLVCRAILWTDMMKTFSGWSNWTCREADSYTSGGRKSCLSSSGWGAKRSVLRRLVQHKKCPSRNRLAEHQTSKVAVQIPHQWVLNSIGGHSAMFFIHLSTIETSSPIDQHWNLNWNISGVLRFLSLLLLNLPFRNVLRNAKCIWSKFTTLD